MLLHCVLESHLTSTLGASSPEPRHISDGVGAGEGVGLGGGEQSTPHGASALRRRGRCSQTTFSLCSAQVDLDETLARIAAVANALSNRVPRLTRISLPLQKKKEFIFKLRDATKF